MQVWKCMHINSYIYIHMDLHMYIFYIYMYIPHVHKLITFCSVLCQMLRASCYHQAFSQAESTSDSCEYLRVQSECQRPLARILRSTTLSKSGVQPFNKSNYFCELHSVIYILIFARIDPVCIRPPCFAFDYMYIYIYMLYMCIMGS